LSQFLNIDHWGRKMDLATALVAIGGAAVGAVVTAFARPIAEGIIPANLSERLKGLPEPRNRINGDWDSWWGIDPEHVEDNHEIISISRQRGELVWGTARRDEEPGKIWDLEGHFDGRHLQLFYIPSASSKNTNFSDYGCYFFVRLGTGVMEGLSIGEGPNKHGKDTVDHEVCRMRLRG
jgi:hypothetical protein